jgi:hypothetical protein
VTLSIEPEPTGPEREAIEAVLAGEDEPGLDEWARIALAEGVEQEDSGP